MESNHRAEASEISARDPLSDACELVPMEGVRPRPHRYEWGALRLSYTGLAVVPALGIEQRTSRLQGARYCHLS